MKPTCYTNTNTYEYNFINMWIFPLCGTGYHTIKIKIIL